MHLFLLVCFCSQSYDIGKANMKYGPGSEALVRPRKTEWIELAAGMLIFENKSLKRKRKYNNVTHKQAKVLRLLATCYLEWDCEKFQEKALNTVSLANKVGREAILRQIFIVKGWRVIIPMVVFGRSVWPRLDFT